MGIRNINIWYVASFLISLIVAVPILTVFSSFFETTGNYTSIMMNTFFYDYIYNSLILLIGVLLLTFIIGVGSAYLVSFYDFPGASFFEILLANFSVSFSEDKFILSLLVAVGIRFKWTFYSNADVVRLFFR